MSEVLGTALAPQSFFELTIEALANELAARCLLSDGDRSAAKGYMQEARYCYLRWGASAKVGQLDEEYPELLAMGTSSAGSPAKSVSTTLDSTSTDSHHGRN